jgi:hypothetical protein
LIISVQHLIDRARHVRSRADEVAAVRRGLAKVTGTPDEIASARRLRALREELTAALENTASCATCARGYPLPHGRWDGGHCCGGATSGVFDDDEIAALALAGTSPRDMIPPRGDHAGCAFRGPGGCSLAPHARPNICVRYTCRTLEGELVERGDRKQVAAIQEKLRREFAHFTALRDSRAKASRT